jgi:cell division protein FtsN
MLPGDEVQMSDAEIAATERAEAQRTAATQRAADRDDAASPAAGTAPATPATATGTATDAPYLLQAGAFGASGDAEATKAKVALLGLSARVESAQIGGRTVYRVRMGPYATASELAEAKRKLASGGLPAMAIKAK